MRMTHLLSWRLTPFILLAILSTLVYSNTFSVPFQFDDANYILKNTGIRDIRHLTDFASSRYIGDLTFALNFYFGRLDVFGYHLVNLIIHTVNSFLIYILVFLLLRTRPHTLTPLTVSSMALVTAFLFVTHPVQTQAVTYIVQRLASLAALFYLLAVVSYIHYRTRDGKSRYGWLALALLSTLLAMKTKENTFTLPFLLFLVEFIFFRRSYQKWWIALVPFFMMLPIIPFSRIAAFSDEDIDILTPTMEIGRTDYLLTQFRVILTYLRLLFLPINQNLDYDYPIFHSLFDLPVLLSFLFLIFLFSLAIYLLLTRRELSYTSKLTAFGILWFFITLSIESSIIPIQDVIFEHRLYLPSVGFFISIVAVMYRTAHLLSEKYRYRFLKLLSSPPVSGALFLLILLSYSFATYQRNFIWQDELSLWQDVVRKSPNKSRGHNNLGIAYSNLGRIDEAISEYQTALRFPSVYAAESHYNLGNAFYKKGRLNESIHKYRVSLGIKPESFDSHYNLALAYRDAGQLNAATRELQEAIRINPEMAEAHNNLGNVYFIQGKFEEAIETYQQSIRLDSDNKEALYNLGLAYSEIGRSEEARSYFLRASEIDPNLPMNGQGAASSQP